MKQRIHSLRTWLAAHYAWFGIAGSLLVSLTTLITAIAYRGFDGLPYSFLNHYISELGYIGPSELAPLFNAGLIAGGVLFLPFVIGLGLYLPGWLSKLGILAGVFASVNCSLVGVFPMNRIAIHGPVAMNYFRGGLVTVLLFGLAILLQPKKRVVLPKTTALASLFAVLCFAAFLVYIQVDEDLSLNILSSSGGRPTVWLKTVLEWLVFFSTLVWFLVIGLTGLPHKKKAG